MNMHSETTNIQIWLTEAKLHIQAMLKHSRQVSQKDDQTPVTEIDQRIESIIRQNIMQLYPEDGIIGEEMAAHQPNAQRQWVIDPIDGTRALIGGFPTFTTLISMLQNDRPIISGMMQAVTGEIWIGVHEQKTIHNEQTVECNKTARQLSDACFATTSHLLCRESDRPLFDLLLKQSKLYQLGGDGYAYGKMACGTVDVIVESGMQPYDFLPLVPIITGAGGIMTDWEGKELTLHSNGDVIAASNRELHNEVLTIIQQRNI